MKRSSMSIRAASVAAFALSGAAHAQSSVTLYGIVDAGIEYVNHASDDSGVLVRVTVYGHERPSVHR